MVGTREKNHPMEINMVCIRLRVDISYLVNEEQATIHRTTEVRYRVRDWVWRDRSHMEGEIE